MAKLHPNTFIYRWQSSAISEESRSMAKQLASDTRTHLRENRIEDAQLTVRQMHTLSQDHAGLHAYGHWLHAKVYIVAGQRRSAVRHLYLTVMAPYGTLRRRIRST